MTPLQFIKSEEVKTSLQFIQSSEVMTPLQFIKSEEVKTPIRLEVKPPLQFIKLDVKSCYPYFSWFTPSKPGFLFIFLIFADHDFLFAFDDQTRSKNSNFLVRSRTRNAVTLTARIIDFATPIHMQSFVNPRPQGLLFW
jgi:hypothetical protein